MLLVKEKEKENYRKSHYVIISAIICDDATFIFESAGTKSSGSNHLN